MNNKVNEALVNARQSVDNAFASIQALLNAADKNNTFAETYEDAYLGDIRKLFVSVDGQINMIANDLKQAKFI